MTAAIRFARRAPAAARLFIGIFFLATLAGCLGERSYPMVWDHLVRLTPAQIQPQGERLDMREWTRVVQQAAAVRLGDADRNALLTDDLSNGADITNVWQHFGIDPAHLDSLFWNWRGIEQTAQVSSPAPQIVNGHIHRTNWKGFQDIDVPVSGGAILFARLGSPEKANEISGSFIIVTHGLFGTLDGFDMENHVQALRRAGHHVLALEMRGHGETLYRHPEYAMTFGITESADLLAAARWLKAAQGATRVGLVSFSLSAYEALLTAWMDGAADVTEFAGDPVLATLPKRQPTAAFNGGMVAVSAPMGVVELADRFETSEGALESPIVATFQDRIAQRLADYHQPPARGMWTLAESEFTRGGYLKDRSPDAVRASLIKFIDLSVDHWQVGARRMENIRVPVLVLSAANDPLATAQNIADLFGRVHNPNIGVILLRQGGHMGFSALSADYYYSLLINFFDPKTAPAVISPP